MKKREIYLEYQNYIDYNPIDRSELHTQACANDDATVNAWLPVWTKNIKENHKKYGPFENNTAAQFFGYGKHKPVIVAGAGPSLKDNAHELKNKGSVLLVSCLHNFHFLEDLEINVDFYLTLDAGEVTIEEVSEGGTKTEEEYWKLTEGKKLLAYIGTSPRLLEKWRGEIYFFNAPVPHAEFIKLVDEIEVFNALFSTGGNVLGACLYFAKAFLGASIISFVGADLSFSYEKKFHGWDSKYDAKPGNVLRVTDVFGNKVSTWKSYHNFKGWFEWVTMTVPGIYYNCSEGGTLGAYIDGNIRTIIQMPLAEFLKQLNVFEKLSSTIISKDTKDRIILF